ncbi:MAG: hypothetical protein CFE23_12715 [Flavobacterium sp. BFFFF1]|uniref:hypothetical protein n=1 Tax=Flavobacterium sp. BFFFF1 TaxID=2015557 RepID=UPI000BC45EF1|nr:hypothetical protein [Flavobacterium sp. BFFFF1]OYU79761.1 MAG: hypothetical protein CFE23_12715 [Flavobacterium sp. BFFFF1]
MKNKNTIMKNEHTVEKQLVDLHYPPSEDAFNKLAEESEIDPEDVSQNKPDIRISNTQWNEKDFNQDQSGADLDIPGSSSDDANELAGNEDEENNGYSIAGDDHNDLDEN